MIDLYASSSPNVQKIILMLEETALAYRIVPVNVHRGEQYSDAFTRLNPNRKVPLIVDHEAADGRTVTIFESGAILIYLAEKTGQFLPTEPETRSEVLQWLMIQLTGVGPIFGQFNHFARYAADDSYGFNRFVSETRRLYDLLDARLSGRRYLGGDAYSIADVATFPWIRVEARLFGETFPVMRAGWPEHPGIARWYSDIESRPAVRRAISEIDARPSTLPTASADDLDRYFGRGQFLRSLG